MNYIALTLFSVTQSVELSTKIFAGMLVNFKMVGLYTKDVPEYHIKQFQIVETLRSELPKLFKHLDRLKIDLSMFSCEWIMTLF